VTSAGLRLTIYTADHPDADPDVRRWAEMMLGLMYDREVIDRFAELVWRQAPQAFREEEQIYPLNELLEVLSRLTTVVERWLQSEDMFAPRNDWMRPSV
jgi:hypothetical protein